MTIGDNVKISIVRNIGDTFYVGGSGPNNYTRIQDAIDNATHEDIIFVYNGIYYEIVDIDKSILLIGEDKNNTIIQANDSKYCIRISAYGVQITNFTIKRIGKVYSDGVISISSTNNIIRENIIYDTDSSGVYFRDSSHSNIISKNKIISIPGKGWFGIDAYFSSDNQILGNYISGFYRGVKFGEGANNIVSENTIIDNEFGIFLYHTYNSEITHNYLINNSGECILLMGCAYDKILHNYISGNGIGILFGGAIYTNCSYNTIANSGSWGIEINSVSYGEFYGNKVFNNYKEDIYLDHSVDNLIINDNYFEKGIVFSYGDELEYWNTHTIKDNYAHNGPIRFYKNMKDMIVPTDTAQVILANCSGFKIENLNITSLERGIVLGYSSYNKICNNNLNNIGVGIEISRSDKNIVYNNTISNNGIGILIPVDGINNIIAGNFLIDNQDGFSLNNFMNYMTKENFIIFNNISSSWGGIIIAPTPGKKNHNVIHHNNFLKGNRLAKDYIGGNVWDDGYPSGGNYWCDYEGIDGNGDGFGDTPYNITNPDDEVTGQDRYPFIDPVYIDNIPPVLINLSGPIYGKSTVEYYFTVEAADAEDEGIYCKWDWGDGEVSDWQGPFSSWEEIVSSHSWVEDGTYMIIVKLKAGSETGWSNHIEIIIDSKPPVVEFLRPYKGVYINNYKIIPRFLRMCLVIGDIDIQVDASDEFSGVEHVDFYIDGKLIKSKNNEPFQIRWTRDRIRLFIHAHVIKIVVFDNAGNNVVKRIFVRKFL